MSYPPKLFEASLNIDAGARDVNVLETSIHADANHAGHESSVQANNPVGTERLPVYVDQPGKLALASFSGTLAVSR